MSDWGELIKWDELEKPLIATAKDTDDSGVEGIDDPKYVLYVEKTMRVINSVEEIGLPCNGEQIRIVTLRSFNAALFLAYIAERENIKHICLTVYSINAEAAKLINSLITSGKIGGATILMSNLRNKAHRQKEQLTRDMFVNNPNVDLFFASCHSKIMAIETEAGNHYCIEGSGNLSFNSRIEQYVIDNDRGLYEFTKKWMNDIKLYLRDKKELILT